MPTASELAYIAGLFDGEGCIRHTGKSEHVFITSCYPHHLMWIQKLMGFGQIRSIQDGRPGHRCAYRLDIYGKNARTFIEKIRAFLREKAYQADILLSIKGLPAKSSVRTMAIEELKKAKRINYGPA